MDAEVPDPARYEQLFARLPERFRKYDTAEFHVVTAVNGNQSPSRWMRVNELPPIHTLGPTRFTSRPQRSLGGRAWSATAFDHLSGKRAPKRPSRRDKPTTIVMASLSSATCTSSRWQWYP